MARYRDFYTDAGEFIGTKRRFTINNEYFFNKHFPRPGKPGSNVGFGAGRYDFEGWNTLWNTGLNFAPYTFILVFEYGANSKSGFNTPSDLLTSEAPCVIYITKRREVPVILVGFLTYNDMQYARELFDKEESLIAYTIDIKQNPELIKTAGSLKEEVKTDTY